MPEGSRSRSIEDDEAQTRPARRPRPSDDSDLRSPTRPRPGSGGIPPTPDNRNDKTTLESLRRAIEKSNTSDVSQCIESLRNTAALSSYAIPLDSDLITPLARAMIRLNTTDNLSSKWQIIKALLKHGADPNKGDNRGRSAMVVAMDSIEDHSRLEKVLKLLVEHGADLDANNQAILRKAVNKKGLDAGILVSKSVILDTPILRLQFLVENCNNLEEEGNACKHLVLIYAIFSFPKQQRELFKLMEQNDKYLNILIQIGNEEFLNDRNAEPIKKLIEILDCFRDSQGNSVPMLIVKRADALDSKLVKDALDLLDRYEKLKDLVEIKNQDDESLLDLLLAKLGINEAGLDLWEKAVLQVAKFGFDFNQKTTEEKTIIEFARALYNAYPEKPKMKAFIEKFSRHVFLSAFQAKNEREALECLEFPHTPPAYKRLCHALKIYKSSRKFYPVLEKMLTLHADTYLSKFSEGDQLFKLFYLALDCEDNLKVLHLLKEHFKDKAESLMLKKIEWTINPPVALHNSPSSKILRRKRQLKKKPLPVGACCIGLLEPVASPLASCAGLLQSVVSPLSNKTRLKKKQLPVGAGADLLQPVASPLKACVSLLLQPVVSPLKACVSLLLQPVASPLKARADLLQPVASPLKACVSLLLQPVASPLGACLDLLKPVASPLKACVGLLRAVVSPFSSCNLLKRVTLPWLIKSGNNSKNPKPRKTQSDRSKMKWGKAAANPRDTRVKFSREIAPNSEDTHDKVLREEENSLEQNLNKNIKDKMSDDDYKERLKTHTWYQDIIRYHSQRYEVLSALCFLKLLSDNPDLPFMAADTEFLTAPKNRDGSIYEPCHRMVQVGCHGVNKLTGVPTEYEGFAKDAHRASLSTDHNTKSSYDRIYRPASKQTLRRNNNAIMKKLTSTEKKTPIYEGDIFVATENMAEACEGTITLVYSPGKIDEKLIAEVLCGIEDPEETGSSNTKDLHFLNLFPFVHALFDVLERPSSTNLKPKRLKKNARALESLFKLFIDKDHEQTHTALDDSKMLHTLAKKLATELLGHELQKVDLQGIQPALEHSVMFELTRQTLMKNTSHTLYKDTPYEHFMLADKMRFNGSRWLIDRIKERNIESPTLEDDVAMEDASDSTRDE